MATKEVMGQIKLQIPAGQATPSPPVGPALGQHGVAIMLRRLPKLLVTSNYIYTNSFSERIKYGVDNKKEVSELCYRSRRYL